MSREKSEELLDDMFDPLPEDEELFIQVLPSVDDVPLDDLPLTDDQQYAATISKLSAYCKEDLTYILIPYFVETELGRERKFVLRELDEATDNEIYEWASYICPPLHFNDLPKLKDKKEKFVIFEMVVTYIAALTKHWKIATGSKL
jgi:hypothetical protein